MSRLMQRNWAKGVGPELDLTGLKDRAYSSALQLLRVGQHSK